MFGLSGRQLFILFILVVLLFAGTQYIPGYFAAFQFNDFVRQEVKFAATSRKTIDVLRVEILQQAKEFGVPITKKDIVIVRRGPSFTLDIVYHWPINLRIYRHELTFHVSQEGEIFENASN
jgi:hypothetical protein